MCKLIFGITGTTGAGKSSVSRLFSKHGVTVIDADMAAREVVRPGKPCLFELAESFGNGIILPSGELDRKKLAEIAFSDKDKLALLNSVTHKYIKQLVCKKIAEAKTDMCAIDGAALIGSNMEDMCRFTVLVLADRELCLERIKKRDGISDSQAHLRLDAQPSEEFYKEHSDFIIYNNAGSGELAGQVEEIIEQIRKEGYE
ncbi:MAG: dephospho-CoA kinase [Clostridiales bacterium]|nr:dephospho-CoA kinase [Clostridiales bacterium]